MEPLLGSIWQTLLNEFTLSPREAELLAAAGVRLLGATILGGALGTEREWAGKIAGLRTHMLTALGAALFVLGPRLAGVNDDGVTRVIQGIVAGIGFLGGGVILKQSDEHRIKGVTTAASIWVAAAIGIGAGLGQLCLSGVVTVMAVVILRGVHRLEGWINPEANEGQVVQEKKSHPRSRPH